LGDRGYQGEHQREGGLVIKKHPEMDSGPRWGGTIRKTTSRYLLEIRRKGEVAYFPGDLPQHKRIKKLHN